MGTSRDDFVKYPRTPHLFGSKGTEDDRHLGRKASLEIISDPSLIVEEKLDGTNTGIHFTSDSRMVLQCRGHEITEGMHPQYDLFKQWTAVKRPVLERILTDRYILFGEWLYAKHSIHYLALTHYFYEFDLYDKIARAFLSWDRRMEQLDGTGIETVPIVHRGVVSPEELTQLIRPSGFGARFDNPATGQIDDLAEGLYVRTEREGVVAARAKLVRPEFVERIQLSEHWQHQKMIPNELAEGADIWS
jgi:hypothetical protein